MSCALGAARRSGRAGTRRRNVGMPRAQWEARLRVRLRCPRYFTANEGASELLRATGAALIAGWCIWACGPPLLTAASLIGAHCSAGLALCQYVHYTSRTHAECWEAERAPVITIVAASGVIAAFIALPCTLVLPLLLQSARVGAAPLLLALCAAVLLLPTAAVGALGSLYDGTAKSIRRGKRE